MGELVKDAILSSLAETYNVAQFVSASPGQHPAVRFSRIAGIPADRLFPSLRDALRVLLERSPERSVNVRSFAPTDPKSREFVYGISNLEELEGTVRRLAKSGLYTIANETVDVSDGGVSGVSLGDLVEVAPDDTPRCVEKPGTFAAGRDVAQSVLTTVYGFVPNLPQDTNLRVEFSIHPTRRGIGRDHVLVWEVERIEDSHPVRPLTRWPNRFSRLIGDKTFGLLIADANGLRVPRTTVVARRIAPFSFGTATGCFERWIRTCPTEQKPGKYTTRFGWADPFILLAREDPTGSDISAVLSQEAVDGRWSGAAHESATGLIIEGVAGRGDDFMKGSVPPDVLPFKVRESVQELARICSERLGPVRFEWVHDGTHPWIVQLHSGRSVSSGRTVVPGSPTAFRRFDVSRGLEALRALAGELAGGSEGILVIGDVGVTSHFGDVLRRSGIPSRIERRVTDE